MAILGAGSGTGYPSAIDTAQTEVDSPAADKTIVSADTPNDLAAAIIAIQTELGINPSGSLATLLLRLAVEHKTDGTHEDITADSLVTTGNINSSGGDIQIGGISVINPTGVILPYIGATAPSGWIIANGDTIGDVGSGADDASADNEALFTLLWNSMADAQAPVSTGRGVSAAADWAAGKTITIPDLRGKFPGGAGGTAMATLGDSGGAETHTLVESEIPAHTHTQIQSLSTGGSAFRATNNDGSNPTATNQNTVTSTGGDGAHENMPPWVALAYIIKL